MWIQYWSPRNPHQWAIWKDGDQSYWAFTRNRGRIRNISWAPYICYRIGTKVYGDTVPTRSQPMIWVVELDHPTSMPIDHEITGTAEEIDALWEQIMHNPTSFMIRQAL